MRPDDNVVLRWNDTMLAAIRLTAGSPPVNSRALAILNTAIYDAWAAYNVTAKATQPNASGLGEQAASPEGQIAAISHAAHAVLTALPPYRTARDSSGAHPADVRLAELGLVAGDGTTAALIGRGAAQAVLAARAADGANQANGYLDPTTDSTRYVPRGSYADEASAFLWQPLPLPGQSETASPVALQRPAVPHWRNVTTFGLPANWRYDARYAAPGPRTSRGNVYKREAGDIVSYVANLDNKRKACAVYWADGPGSETPPFPEYTSGHSTFSAAAAQVLRNATGSDRMALSAVVPAGAGASFLSPGKTPPAVDSTLSWPTFTDAVAGPGGSGISRLYGGIHFADANDHGQTTGTAAGQAAWEETRRYLSGARGY